MRIKIILIILTYIHICQREVVAKPSDSDVTTSTTTSNVSTEEVTTFQTIITDSLESTTSADVTTVLSSVSKSKSKKTKKPTTKKMGINMKRVKDGLSSHDDSDKKDVDNDDEDGDKDDDDEDDEENDEENHDDITQHVRIRPMKRRRKKMRRIKTLDPNTQRLKKIPKHKLLKERKGKQKIRTHDSIQHLTQEKQKPKTRTFGLLAGLLSNPFQFMGGRGNTLHIITLYRRRYPFFTNPTYYYDTDYAYYDDQGSYDSYYDSNYESANTIFVSTTAEPTEAAYEDTTEPA